MLPTVKITKGYVVQSHVAEVVTGAVTDGVKTTRKTAKISEEAAVILTPKNLYARYTDFPWGLRDFNPNTEFSGGRKAWGTSTNPHTKKIREIQKKLLRPLLSWEWAKDWKRQKVNRALKAGIKEYEYAMITKRAISTRTNQLTNMERRKFERLVQRTWEVMYIRKKAYILYQWYELSDEQQRYYLELEEQEELPAFQIPKGDLEEIGIKSVQHFAMVISVVPINRQAYARFEGPTEHDTRQDGVLAIVSQMMTKEEELADGGTDDYLSDEDPGTDIEEDYDDKPNRQDDDKDTKLWRKWEASGGSSEEEETQLTKSDSGERRAKKPVKDKKIIEVFLWPVLKLRKKGLSVSSGDTPSEFLPSNTEDKDYRAFTEEDDDKVNERVYQWILRRGAILTSRENNEDNTGEKEVGANNGEKDMGEDEDEDRGEHDDEGGDDDEGEDQSEDEGDEVD
ncbi:hypothetical protein EV426DRAFT_706051 [Tirmania nivea]|nr:hypothetical protein EV426DRAFT_706051 [Tirmania nivea]